MNALHEGRHDLHDGRELRGGGVNGPNGRRGQHLGRGIGQLDDIRSGNRQTTGRGGPKEQNEGAQHHQEAVSETVLKGQKENEESEMVLHSSLLGNANTNATPERCGRCGRR